MSDVESSEPSVGQSRRSFLSYAAMVGGLLASFGGVVLVAARYIYPRRGVLRVREIFLAPVSDIPPGKSRVYALPTGGRALVTNTGADVVALSNICPHLGCKVHWEEEKRHFFCPCHGGVFDPEGKATAGPPADEKTDLQKFELKRVGDNLFIKVEEIVHV